MKKSFPAISLKESAALLLLREYSFEVAKIYYNFGVLNYSLGEGQSAIDYIDLSLSIKRELFREEHHRFKQTLGIRKQIAEKVESIDLLWLDF